MNEGINHFKGDYYIQRQAFTPDDPKDDPMVLNPTTVGNYLLRQIETRTTFGIPMEQPIHAAAMNRKSKMVDHFGHEALAGRASAIQPVPVNGTKKRYEPLILNLMNDRLCLMQEMTIGLCVRYDEEIALLKALYAAGAFGPREDDEGEEYEVGQ